MGAGYIGRFAPSPTGPLHAGSLVAALASWLDARAHAGRWLVRIEDVDRPRCVVGAAEEILRQLAACGMEPDETPLWQSSRDDAYDRALAHLSGAGWTYPCGCTRKEIADGGAVIPLDVVNRIADGENPIRVIREWKDITQLYLAHKTNIGQGYISDLENGRRKGTVAALKEIARVLDVPLGLLA